MEVRFEHVGRRFGRDWIFRGVNASIAQNQHVIFVGPNGSGKSTLLQITSGFLSPSEGEVVFFGLNGRIGPNNLHQCISYAAPYLDLYEDLTLLEAIDFHMRFRQLRAEWNREEVMQLMELSRHRDKQIRNFSSGMRQRVRLALAILTDSEVLCLDEPTSNLDRNAISWFRDLLEQNSTNRIVLVSTNHNVDDYLRADLTLQMNSFISV
jgi:ABC-type multidrug transport system ATPase subunit